MLGNKRRDVCVLIATALLLGPSLTAQTPAPVVDHLTVDLFDQIPANYLSAASQLRLLFVNRSVGNNQNEGLECLTYPYDSAPNYCKRWTHSAPEFSVPESPWVDTYPRDQWRFNGWPGTGITPELPCGGAESAYWHQQLDCFIRHIDANPNAYDVAAFQFSYLEVTETSDVAHPVHGFFGSNPPAGRRTVADLEALRTRRPNIRFVLMTSSLGRSIGSVPARDFNAGLRDYARTHNWPLYDFAGFTSHDPYGLPCFDNRDGVPYIADGVLRENYPDDGIALPAICQHYTGDVDGGHLRTAGRIRAAKSWWVLMARLAGWNPSGLPGPTPPQAPRNLRIVGSIADQAQQ